MKFQPGQSGNPGGRPKGLRAAVRAEVGDDGDEIIKAILRLARGARTPAKVRLDAWCQLRDMAGWRPATTNLIGGVDGGEPVTVTFGGRLRDDVREHADAFRVTLAAIIVNVDDETREKLTTAAEAFIGQAIDCFNHWNDLNTIHDGRVNQDHVRVVQVASDGLMRPLLVDRVRTRAEMVKAIGEAALRDDELDRVVDGRPAAAYCQHEKNWIVDAWRLAETRTRHRAGTAAKHRGLADRSAGRLQSVPLKTRKAAAMADDKPKPITDESWQSYLAEQWMERQRAGRDCGQLFLYRWQTHKRRSGGPLSQSARGRLLSALHDNLTEILSTDVRSRADRQRR